MAHRTKAKKPKVWDAAKAINEAMQPCRHVFKLCERSHHYITGRPDESEPTGMFGYVELPFEASTEPARLYLGATWKYTTSWDRAPIEVALLCHPELKPNLSVELDECYEGVVVGTRRSHGGFVTICPYASQDIACDVPLSYQGPEMFSLLRPASRVSFDHAVNCLEEAMARVPSLPFVMQALQKARDTCDFMRVAEEIGVFKLLRPVVYSVRGVE